jgi:hypothetical protein
VRIVFTIADRSGQAVSMDGALAVYKIARRAGGASLLAKTEENGVTLDGNTAAVAFNAGELADDLGPLLGDFFGQLTVTKDGAGLVVAEGPLSVGSVIV